MKIQHNLFTSIIIIICFTKILNGLCTFFSVDKYEVDLTDGRLSFVLRKRKKAQRKTTPTPSITQKDTKFLAGKYLHGVKREMSAFTTESI